MMILFAFLLFVLAIFSSLFGEDRRTVVIYLPERERSASALLFWMILIFLIAWRFFLHD